MDDLFAGDKLETLAKSTSSAEKGLNAGLCGRCDNSTVFRRKGLMTPQVRCSLVKGDVPSDIEECSAFSSPKSMSLWDMQQIALAVDGRKGVDDKAYL